MKICIKCNEEKSLLEYHRDKGTKDGFRSICKVCQKIYCAQNKKAFDEVKKLYRKNNKEKVAKKSKETNAIYYINNRNIIIKKNSEYANSRRLTDLEYKNKCNIRTANYRNMKKSKDCNKSSSSKIIQLFEIQNYECIYCKVDISESKHIDHIIPLSKNGSNLITNLALACPECNMTKSNKDLDIWLKEININYDDFMLKLNERNNSYFKDEIKEG